MHLYWVKTNWLIKRLFRNMTWSIKTTDRNVYLTFDDGPIPEITPWVLEQLRVYNYKATFFCIGENAARNPEIVQQIIDEGHRIGNHTYNHVNGWKTTNKEYADNIKRCQAELNKSDSNKKLPLLFRPPYGKITARKATLARKLGYKIIMWDILSADFDSSISKEQCLNNVISNIRPGSIIVFHDSIKAFPHLQYVLPKVVAHLKVNDYECKSL
ncbi:MAG: polysaccharide deacetylase family protein [Flavobacterium sp.]